MRLIKNVVLSSLILSLAIFSAQTSSANNGKQYGKDHPFTINQLPPGQFKQSLKVLPDAAQKNALDWMHKHSFTEQDFNYLRVDKLGGIFYEEPMADASLVNTNLNVSPALAELNLTDTFSLHSKPGATRTIFIDVDGREVTGTLWNTNSGVDPLIMKPYDSDGDETSFSQTELNQIAETWKRVAEDFAPFDVDVTTEDPRNFGPNVGVMLVTQKTDQNGNNIYNCSCGGVAYVGVWGRSNFESYQPALVFTEGVGTGAHNISEAGSHEIGHNLGLSHDGNDVRSYYTGHGTGNVQWAPIMGVGYSAEVTQWSKGEYLNANQTQDDIQIITNNLNSQADDHANSDFNQASVLSLAGANVIATNPVIDPFNTSPFNKGIIENRDDVDLFSFSAGSGALDLTVTPGWIDNFSTSNNRGMNIDIEATLFDANGNVITTSNPIDDTFAQVTANLTAGNYYLGITGVGKGDLLGTGYSDYGSLGQYYINGTVPESNDGTPSADFSFTCNELSCDFDAANSSDNDGTIISYVFDLGDGTIVNEANFTHVYSAAGSYSVSLTVTDNDNLSDTMLKNVEVTVPVPPTALFTASCSDLDCTFDASNSTDDSSIVSYVWDFGDGASSTGVNASHSYSTAGTFTVNLTVTDNDNLSDSSQTSVTTTTPAPQPPATPSNLIADAIKEGRGKNATLTSVSLAWSDNSNNETGFEIERCVESGKGKNKVCNYSLYASVGSNTTNYSDETPVNNSRYRVRAINASGTSSYSNSVKP